MRSVGSLTDAIIQYVPLHLNIRLVSSRPLQIECLRILHWNPIKGIIFTIPHVLEYHFKFYFIPKVESDLFVSIGQNKIT